MNRVWRILSSLQLKDYLQHGYRGSWWSIAMSNFLTISATPSFPCGEGNISLYGPIANFCLRYLLSVDFF